MRQKARKKRKAVARVVPDRPTRPNERWAMDFVHDRFADGRSFRVLTVVDIFDRQSLVLEASGGFTGKAVAEVLDRVAKQRGYPALITVDNGTEFTSKALDAWAFEHEVRLDFIRLGKPTENGFIESFNGRLRDECLNVEIFQNLDDAKRKLMAFRLDYNRVRPHSSLGNLPPSEYAARWKNLTPSP